MNKKRGAIFLAFIGLLLLNTISHYVYKRFDLTADKRYTLSSTTQKIISRVNQHLFITVYLEGDFPPKFKKLQQETKQFLEELTSENKHIIINFKTPGDNKKELRDKGMLPSELTVKENGKLSLTTIYPWAELNYKNKSTTVSLLPENLAASQQAQLQSAIENLEYLFSNAIHFVLEKKQKKVAVLTGNGELKDIFQYSFLSELTKKYKLAKFTLDSATTKPAKTLQDLSRLDLAIITKPTKQFTENEKFVLDQFITNGGKTLWMIDNVIAEQDSLYKNGKLLAYPRELNITDLLFSYGIRINNSLIKDLYAAQISLATGKAGNQTQFKNLEWFFHPVVGGNPNHSITKNTLPVRLQFVTAIDTLQNNIKKTPLLLSSVLTKSVGTPSFINLQSIAEEVIESEYNSGNHVFAVLLEGNFNSAYKNRLKPFKTRSYKENATNNKMIVISDGDVGKNQILKGKPYDLSRDKWTNQVFGNKDFLINAIDYLLDDSGLIDLRNKTLQIRLLDKKKSNKERRFWQILNVVAPLILLAFFGIIFTFYRKRKYR